MNGTKLFLGGTVLLGSFILGCDDKSVEMPKECVPGNLVTISRDSIKLSVGSTSTVQAREVSGEGCHIPGTGAVLWEIRDAAVAQIASYTDTTATLIGKGVGSTIIIAQGKQDPNAKAAQTVVVR